MVIPGNHDFYPIAHILFKDKGIDWKFDFSPNVHFLGDRGTEVNGVKFYGTPWVPIISYSWAFEGFLVRDLAAVVRPDALVPVIEVILTDKWYCSNESSFIKRSMLLKLK